MYVYRENLKTLMYEVGYYDSYNIWHMTSAYPSQLDAVSKVHYLNGNELNSKWRKIMMLFADWRLHRLG